MKQVKYKFKKLSPQYKNKKQYSIQHVNYTPQHKQFELQNFEYK